MKKYLIVTSMMVTAVIFYNCHSSKKLTSSVHPPLNYEANLKTVIEANCSPCHIPAKGGNKKAYDNFANVKTDIDEMIRRMELNPADKGFMPFKKQKLGDSTITAFKQWRTDGLLEK
jgi:nitrate/TMAO reductase-like tetraheme cytochrome c subunit